MSRWLVFVMGLLLPVAAFAAGDSEAGGQATHFWEAFNLVVLISVLVYLTRKPLRNYLADRRSSIQENLASSEQLLRDAENRLAEWNDKTERLDEEVEELRRVARQRGERERERILADARSSAERIRRDAQSAIDRELRRAREILRAEASELAVQLAGERLREHVTDADRDRLVDEFVQRIEQGDASPTRGNGAGGSA